MIYELVLYFGVVVIGLLGLYAVLFILYRLVGISTTNAVLPNESMPKLRPIPIPTKHQKTRLQRLLAFVFIVRRWELVESWQFQLGDGTVLMLHKGFEFDGASVPRPFWAFLSPTGLLLLPGLVHDYGYRYRRIWRLEQDGEIKPFWVDYEKEHWDKVFLEIAREVNGMWTVNVIAWLAVTLAGKRSWDARKDQLEQPPLPS